LSEHQGRLELTWTNKHLRLLAHEDGSYEWVSPSDYRVAEVRLLDDVTTVGDVNRARALDNLLIRGDALNALRSLARLPEFAAEYLGKVKLAYLDPPFNTQQSFLHYDDALEHSVWLTMMRDRLIQIRELLAPGGSVWVHLDDSEIGYCRVMMDEIFGPTSFVSTVVWEGRYSRSNDAALSVSHNYMLVYARDGLGWRHVRNKLPRTPEQAKQSRPGSQRSVANHPAGCPAGPGEPPVLD
jgi:adenine-specific DNA-methyltransferase